MRPRLRPPGTHASAHHSRYAFKPHIAGCRQQQQPGSSCGRSLTTTSSAASPPTQAPTAALQASHTSISLPLGPIDLFGNYSIIGPAVIRKINNALVALVQPGGAVSVLNSSSAGPTYMPCASLSHDEDTSAVVNLSGQHLELDGSFELHHMSQRTIEHDGKVIVSPATLSEDSCILLLPGGCVSHPVNVHPQQKRP